MAVMETKKPLTTEQFRDAQRLKALYESKKKELKITQYTIADALGVSQGAVGHYMNGRIALNVPMVTEFARILNVSVDEISPSLAREVSKYASTVDANIKGVRPYTSGSKYPVLSKIQAGSWAEACEPYTLKDVDLWLESDAHVQGDSFWLEVDGDSMTSPHGLSIPEGTFVLFDTGREPVNGSLVVAKLVDDNEATFKKLVIDGSQKYLRGLNPQWPMVPINGNCRIIGVAIETKMRLV